MSAQVDDVSEPRKVLLHEPMAKHTSWRVGGPADSFIRPRSLAELREFLASLDADVPLTFIGLGSNLLVRDGGIRGAVICTSGLPREVERLEGGRVRAGAALACATLARRCARWHLGPAAFFAGIPGTLGGALAMNAGAFGGETWDRVASVVTIGRDGSLRDRSRDDFDVGYRTVVGPAGEWFVEATLALDEGAFAEPVDIKSLLEKRTATQPLGRPSAGSVFRNPPGEHAGRLIEAAGLKGLRIGNAEISPKHANFIINLGGASAADIEALIERARSVVRERFGVALEAEVRILGERGEGGS
jgi:UDP-N-acetylmuramate dehydrogenase